MLLNNICNASYILLVLHLFAGVIASPTGGKDGSIENKSLSARGLTTDQQSALEVHNQARAEYSIAPLVWDTKLEAGARNWAQTIVKTGEYKHSGQAGMGENIFMSSVYEKFYFPGYPRTMKPNTILTKQMWDQSITKKKFFGDYTQCIWGNTTRVGMASVRGVVGGVPMEVVVAWYSPQGNWIDGPIPIF
ncbi:SCP-like extracellular protein [Fusarium austroafricanum]|uniref:SCP-like extracellular protein n=1 Tax=Fusarium austroafricanum TaxID=2364996 RepID=A0A8H4KL06_9HYPO|nr:SCP-like extracellular protein [Fusarium austroafricanum]